MSTTTTPLGRGARRRRAGILASLAVAGALVSAGLLAGCGESSSAGAAGAEPAVQAQYRDPSLPPPTTHPNPDTNRERAFERAGVLPPDGR